MCRFGRAQPEFCLQCGGRGGEEAVEATKFLDKTVREGDGILARQTGAQQNGNKLGIGEDFWPSIEEFFAGAFAFGALGEWQGVGGKGGARGGLIDCKYG